MSLELQVLVDRLADTLKRPAMVDDARWRAVAYSAVDERVDEVRLRSILQRQAPDDAITWACGLGVDAATTPVRMPANPGLGADPRLLINLRRDQMFLGRLVMVDHDADITDNEVREADRGAGEIAHLLHQQRMIEGGARERERTILRDLLGDYPEPRTRAAHTIRDEGLLAKHRLTALMVLRIQGREPAQATGQWSVLEQVVEWLRRSVGPGRSLSLVRPGHAVVLVGAHAPSEIRELAREMRDRAAAVVGPAATVGICPMAKTLEDGEASIRRATAAARVAARIPRFEHVASWRDLSGYGALITLMDDEPLDRGLLDPALALLVEGDRHGALLHTLESYLDYGGDVQRTAQHVSLQRAGLYYRLRRIEEITGVDLKDGEARLGLHMSIKLLRLSGSSQLAPPCPKPL